MEVTVTTQLENLIVTPDSTDMSNTPRHPEEAEAAHTDSTAETLLNGACKTEVCDDDESKDCNRYAHSCTAM